MQCMQSEAPTGKHARSGRCRPALPLPCPCTLTCFMNICMRHFLKLRSSLHTWQKEQVER